MFNVQGLKTRRINKFQSQELKNIFSSNDIIMLTETWADQFTDLTVKGFSHFHINRSEYKANTKRASGGIVIYIREDMVISDKTFCTHREYDDAIWIRIEGTKLNLDGDIYICLCYNLPSDSSRQSLVDEELFDRICNYVNSLKNATEKNVTL